MIHELYFQIPNAPESELILYIKRENETVKFKMKISKINTLGRTYNLDGLYLYSEKYRSEKFLEIWAASYKKKKQFLFFGPSFAEAIAKEIKCSMQPRYTLCSTLEKLESYLFNLYRELQSR